MCRFLRHQEYPQDYQAGGQRRRDLGPSVCGAHLHVTDMKVVGAASTKDQLDVRNPVSTEWLRRGAQLVGQFCKREERSKEKERRQELGGKPGLLGLPAEESGHFLESGKNFFEVVVCPALTERVAIALGREAGIMKQARRARKVRARAQR